MSSRRRPSLAGRALGVAALLLTGLALWPVLAPAPREDRTEACRALAAAVDAAAAKRGLVSDQARAGTEARTAAGVRGEIADRVFRVPPPATVAGAAATLRRAAAARGMLVRVESAGAGKVTLEASFADGRPALRALLRPKRWIALIIDDLGYRLDTARRVIALPARLTCAIIPGTAHGREIAALARRRGQEVMIHLPMESPFKSPDVPEYTTMIRAGMSRADVERRIRDAVRDVPGARTVNNHEGSAATADGELMFHVMQTLKSLNLGFVDSGTTAGTVAWRVARDSGLRWGRRDVFLDNDRALEAIEGEFARAVRVATRRGVAIVIGHHHFPATLDVLERRIPEAERAGVEFVHATAVLRGR